MPKKKGTNIDDIWQKIKKGIKTTYNKITAKKEREQYIIKKIQTKKKEKKRNLNIPFVKYYL